MPPFEATAFPPGRGNQDVVLAEVVSVTYDPVDAGLFYGSATGIQEG